MHNPSLFPFHHLIRQVSPGVMKVNGFDVDIGVEGVLVKENRASSVMGHVEPTSKNVLVDILRCFLQSGDVPPACDLLLEGIFFSAHCLSFSSLLCVFSRLLRGKTSCATHLTTRVPGLKKIAPALSSPFFPLQMVAEQLL